MPKISKNDKDKETLQWQTGYLPRQPMPSDQNMAWQGGWSLGSSCQFKVSSKSAKHLLRCDWEGLKSASFYYVGQWLIQLPVFPYRHDVCRSPRYGLL